MARITVEDCIDKFPSRFELVLVASNRARKLYSGEKPTVEIDNDKYTVIALREIADETIDPDKLRDDIVKGLQKLSNPELVDDGEDEHLEDKSLEDNYTINDELNDFKMNNDSLDVQNKINPGFHDVDENLIKSEDL